MIVSSGCYPQHIRIADPIMINMYYYWITTFHDKSVLYVFMAKHERLRGCMKYEFTHQGAATYACDCGIADCMELIFARCNEGFRGATLLAFNILD